MMRPPRERLVAKIRILAVIALSAIASSVASAAEVQAVSQSGQQTLTVRQGPSEDRARSAQGRPKVEEITPSRRVVDHYVDVVQKVPVYRDAEERAPPVAPPAF